MTAPVNVNGREARDFLADAKAAWGADLPEWVEELAKEATRTTQTAVAKRIGKSVSLVSGVINRKYGGAKGGDLAAVEGTVRGALMGARVLCPVLDEIPRDRCLAEQKMPFAATSPIRSRLYRACRSGCPHSRIKGVDDGE